MFQCDMKTQVSMNKYAFRWTFENFLAALEEKEILVDFQMNKECWYLGLAEQYDQIEIKLHRANSNSAIRMKIFVSITDKKGTLYHKYSNHFRYEKQNGISSSEVIAVLYGDTTCKLKYESNNAIVITLNLQTFIISTRELGNLPQEDELQTEEQKSFSADILAMYEKSIQADIVLLVKGEKINCHKLILCARSPVFSKMFQLKMAESEENVIRVEDVSVSAMKEVINFLYSRVKVDYDLDTALDVYYAADKYEVLKLRELCAKIILNKLNSENAGPLLKIADRHNDDTLKTKLMQFIKDNFEICVKEYWWDCFKNGKNKDIFYELMAFISE